MQVIRGNLNSLRLWGTFSQLQQKPLSLMSLHSQHHAQAYCFVHLQYFMTFAWYGHLKDWKRLRFGLRSRLVGRLPCLNTEVPANRLGVQYFSLPQLKVLQEVITMVVFAGFSAAYMKVPVTRNYFFAAMLLAGAAYLIFNERSQSSVAPPHRWKPALN